MRVLIVTGSTRPPCEGDALVIANWIERLDADRVYLAGSEGTMEIALEAVRQGGYPHEVWEADTVYGPKAAALYRNADLIQAMKMMRSEGHHVLAVAFPSADNKGTACRLMIKSMRRHEFKVIVDKVRHGESAQESPAGEGTDGQVSPGMGVRAGEGAGGGAPDEPGDGGRPGGRLGPEERAGEDGPALQGLSPAAGVAGEGADAPLEGPWRRLARAAGLEPERDR